MRGAGLFERLAGYCEISCDARDTERLLSLCAKTHTVYRGLHRGEEKTEIRIFARDVRYFRAHAKQQGLECEIGDMRGLPALLYRYRRRWGVWCGCIVFALLVWVSQLFVWNVTVSGNSEVSTKEIIKRASEAGCGVGSFIPGIDFDRVYLNILTDHNDISWISAVRTGTTVNFEVLEVKRNESHFRPEGSANLVARSDGQIESLEVLSGIAAVSAGDVVKKGELLVSGVMDLREDRFKLTHADGKVYARVEKQISVSVPMLYEVKEVAERKISEIGVIFFSNYIKFSINTGISGQLCDTITKEEWVSVPSMPRLPLCLVTKYDIGYASKQVQLDEKQAMAVALSRLENEIAVATASGELLEKRIKARFEDDCFILDCTILCIEDIAQVCEIPTE